MRTTISILALAAVALLGYRMTAGGNERESDSDSWTTEFVVEKNELSSKGRNQYFILEPGYRVVFKSKTDELVITVLDETKTVDGVETRVVEERETKRGELYEVSRNFFAISKRTNCVFYFGEEVDFYKGRKVTSHEGAWLAGEKGAKPGLAMPGQVLLGGRYYQELARGQAMDRAEIVSMKETVDTPAGKFTNCLKIRETDALKPATEEYKYYAPGIGLVQDESMKLVKYGSGRRTAK